VVDIDQARDLSDCGSVAAELIGEDDFWDVVFSQQSGQERLRRFSIAMPLEENVEHKTVLIYSSPKPVSNAIHTCTYLIDMPPGAPTGLPVAQFFGKEGTELDAPLAQSFVTHLDAALVEQFLNVPVTQ